MEIPKIFKDTIKEYFYDKKIEIWTTETITDEEGAVVESGKLDKIDEFYGNFQFSTKEKIKQDYGENIEANAIITCERTCAKEGDTLIYCKNRTHFELSRYTNNELAAMTHDELKYYMYKFEIKSVIPSDSHITILANGVI